MSAPRDTGMHGISPEEKAWLVYKVQGGKCPICWEKLDAHGAAIDHFHGCDFRAAHVRRTTGSRTVEYGCRRCIRGVLHSACNGTLLFWMEKYPHLQNEVVRGYLARRPFQFRKTEEKHDG